MPIKNDSNLIFQNNNLPRQYIWTALHKLDTKESYSGISLISCFHEADSILEAEELPLVLANLTPRGYRFLVFRETMQKVQSTTT